MSSPRTKDKRFMQAQTWRSRLNNGKGDPLPVSALPLPAGASILLAIHLSACTGSPSSRPITSPAAERNVSSVIDPAAGDQAGPESLLQLARLLRTAVPVSSIGATNSSPSAFFARIGDVLASESELLLVADAENRAINVFTREGSFVQSRSASQPLGVSGAHTSRISFSPRAGLLCFHKGVGALLIDVAPPRAVLPLAVNPLDMCILDEDIIFLGPDSNGFLLHKYTLQGEHLTSFARVYETPNRLLLNAIADGFVVAAMGPKIVALATRHLPYVWGFSGNGDTKWVAKLASFDTPSILELPSTGKFRPFRLTGDDGSADLLVSLTHLASHHLLVQSQRGTRIATYILSATDGRGMYVGDDLPLIRSIDLPWIYGAQSRPFPKVLVYRVQDTQ